MVVESKSTTNLRNTWIIVVIVGVIGLAIGSVGGYFGYSFGIQSPLIHFTSDSYESPLDQTYRGMARFAGLEISS